MGIGINLGTIASSGDEFSNNYSLDFDSARRDSVTFTDVIYNDEFTFSFWIKTPSIRTADNLYIAGERYLTDFIQLLERNQILLSIGGSSITFTTTSGDGGNSIELDVWNNIVITRDGSSTVKAFRDGVAFGEATGSLSGDFDFSFLGGTTGGYYTGLMDEVALWNGSDQSSNVVKIYNGGVIRDLTGLLPSDPTYWYRFEEGSGTTANNTMSGEGTGIIGGATYSTDTP